MTKRVGNTDIRDMTIVPYRLEGSRLYYRMKDNPTWTTAKGKMPFYDVPNEIEPFTDYLTFLESCEIMLEQPLWVRTIKHDKTGEYYWIVVVPFKGGAIDWNNAHLFDPTCKPRKMKVWEMRNLPPWDE